MDEKIDCVAAMRQLWDYLDGELTPSRESAIRAHLARCASCYPHFDFEKAFLQALAATRSDRCAPISLRTRVVDALCAAGFVPGCSGAAPPSSSAQTS